MGKKYLGKTMLLIALSAALLGGTLPAQAVEILPNEPVMVLGNYPCPSEEHKREKLVQCCQLDGQRQ